MEKNKLIGFEPVFDQNCRILILGSFPSVLSRQNKFYYGNPRNRFWTILNNFYHENAKNISEKEELLIEHHIALWDIIQSCKNVDSADNHLKDIVFSNLHLVLNAAPIQRILCNGVTAYNFTKKYCSQENISIPLILLPSTSPANTRFDFQSWKNELEKFC